MQDEPQANDTWRSAAVAAACYVALAVVGRLATPALDLSAPVLPAAGIALVAVLRGGPPAILLIAVGAFGVEFALGAASGSAGVSAAIAAGITLQAWLGARLTRGRLLLRHPLTRDRDVFVFLLLAAPVACIVAPAFRVVALDASSQLATDDVWSTAFDWWAAETIGVVLFGPLSLLVWPERRHLWSESRLHLAVPLLGIAAVLVAGHYALSKLEQGRVEREAQARMEESYQEFAAATHRTLEQLRGVQRFFNASEDVTAREFSRYAGDIPGRQGIVSVQWLAREGASRQRASADDRFAVRFVEAAVESPNLAFDHDASPQFRAALTRARDSGMPQSSLLAAGGSAPGNTLLIVPVYTHDLDVSMAAPEQRRDGLTGFVVAEVDIASLLAPLRAAAGRHQLAYRVVDTSDAASPTTLVDAFASAGARSWSRTVEIAGRRWQIETALDGMRPQWRANPSIDLYIALSALAAFLVALATLGTNGRAAAARAEVAERTRELRAELAARLVAEDALQMSERDLATTLHSIADAVLATDSAGRVTRMNGVAEQLTGWRLTDALQRDVDDVVLLTDEEADARTTSLAQQVLRSNAAVRWREMTLRSREGRTHAVTISAAPKRTADGELCGTVLVFHDIDAERQARRALRESEQHYRHFIELSPFAVFVQSDGRFVFVNDRAVALFGADSAQALLGSSVLERVHPDGRLLMSARMLNLREGRAQAAVEQRFLRFDGSAFDGESTAVPYEHQGRPAALVMLQDVSARREAELQLDRFFNLSLDLLCIADRNGRFKRVNQTFQDTLGTSEADLLERPFLDRVHPDDLAATRAAIASLVLGQPLREFSNRHRCEDGSWRWLAWTAVAHSDGFIYATARDVTEQRLIADKMGRLATELELRVAERSQALDALSAKQEEIRALVDNLPNGVITLDANGLIGSANPAMTRLFGFAQDELVGQSLASVVPEAGYMELNAFLDYHVLISRAGTMDIGRELAGRHKAGRELALEFGLGRYVVQGRHSYVATFSDISERKRLTIELTKARTAAEQSSRAKSSFLAAMSHEIRTPMNAVMGMAELLEHTKLSAKQSELVAPIRTSAAALLAIIDDILDFSKIEAGRMELERGSVSIGNTVEAVCMMLAPVASQRNVEVGLYVGSTIPARVMSDEVRLRQIIYNLVGNAVKFSGGRPDVRGRVKISVEDAVGRDNAVCLSVEDNGIGISAEAQAKLFSAFAQADITTTRRYGGTGLGLAICRRLVRLMGGTIEVRSALDTGSLFTVTLPVEIDADAPAETLPDLAGVECVLGTGSFDTASIARYLQEAGARLQVDAGDAALPPRAGTIHLDAGRDSGGRDGALGQSQLTITRIGAPASQAADVVTVYSGVICRRSLLEAVAHAAGRGDPTPGRADYAGHPISATCGPTVPQAEALGRLILVAEDDPINQKVILRQLELIGYAAEVVDNGIRALETWRTQRFALVLTDLQMPEMDGYALVVTIRNEEPVGTHTPVIALTANALSAEALRARAEGFDGYLTKPVQLATLKSELSRWLPPGCEAAISVPRASEREPAPTLDPGVLRALVGDDPVTLAQLYSDFVKLNRRAAADLGSAIAERNVEQVRFIAHRLKSSSLSVGALRLAETCLQLEQAARAGDSEAALAGGSAFEHAFASAETEIARLLGEFPTAATGP